MSVAEEVHEGELVVAEVESRALVEAITSAEIDTQISTAKRYPRSITQFRRDAMEMATLDEDTASSMFYVLPRGGKSIEGPSARLAEVVGSSWGNLRYGARIVSTDDNFVTAQGMCFDLQKNISASIEVKRRITDRNGRRFNDDMIQVTANAACSIALRQAIFKVVPFAFVKPIYEAARRASVGEAATFSTKRHNALEWFKKAGATEAQVLSFLGHKGVDDISVEDLIALNGLKTAISDGDTSIESALNIQVPTAGSKAKPSALNEKLNQKPEAPADAQSYVQKMKERFELAQTAEDAKALLDEYTGPESSYPEDVINLSSAAYDKAIARLSGKGSKQKNLV